MKGKTIIELTNVNTGEVTTYEDENLITYGANKYINTGYINYNSYRTHRDMLPVSKRALGGILLFDNTISMHSFAYFLVLIGKTLHGSPCTTSSSSFPLSFIKLFFIYYYIN